MMKQEAVRASGLISVMLDDERFAREISEQERSERRTRDVNHVRRPNELQKLAEARAANHSKWERGVIVVPRRSLCGQSDIELSGPPFIADLREAPGERKDDSLHPADAWRKEMAVDEEFHPRIPTETDRERGVSPCETISTTSLVIRDCVRMCRNSRQYSGFGLCLAVLSWRR